MLWGQTLVHLRANESARLLAGQEKYTIGTGAVRKDAVEALTLDHQHESARLARSGTNVTHEESIIVSVRVHPGAAREAVSLLSDGSLDVRLRARAVEGQANAELVQLLARRLGLRRREVEIRAGVRSRQKLVSLALASHDDLRQRLAVRSGDSRG
jgi:uncharacterized protein (TIGR00251 family)